MVKIDLPLVQQLIRTQFPQWVSEAIHTVDPQGHDHRSFRLGDDLLVRIPSAQRYVAQVEKEQLYLPQLYPHLTLKIPQVIAQGQASDLFPYPWSIYRWIEGDVLRLDTPCNQNDIALELAHFLQEFQKIDSTLGPKAGAHNFHRGGNLAVYAQETTIALSALSSNINVLVCLQIFDRALASSWTQKDVWVHGDIAVGNLLLNQGHLSAVIDFGSMAVGDPACDYVMAYTFFDTEARKRFKQTLMVDESTWHRTQGWALWKAVITLIKDPKDRQSNQCIKALLEDFGH